MTTASALPDWRRAWGGPTVEALLKASPADFRVTELLDIEFDGGGEHDWLWIEKTDVNSAWLARRLAGYAGIPARDVGYAGRKDRRAVTRQWFSARRPKGKAADWSSLRLPGVEVLTVARHSRKLKLGAHRGNAFVLRLRAVRGDAAERLGQVGRNGVPNYFGEQRFGHSAGNLALARSLFAGRRLKRDKRSLAMSAARSYLFNALLDGRVQEGTWNRMLPGDVASLDGSNSVFDVEAVDASIERRVAELDLHPSGPLWGRGSDSAGQRLLPAECAALQEHAELCAGLERLAAAGRRALRLRVTDLDWSAGSDTLDLSFTLGRGAFATAVLREIADYGPGDGRPDRSRSST